MSQTFFSKQDPTEKASRLFLLGHSKGTVTLWEKGSKDKSNYITSNFDKEREELVLEIKDYPFKNGQTILCTFELRGMSFFSEVVFLTSVSGFGVLHFKNTLFKSERRSSYRLLTYPLYEVWADFNIDDVYQGGNVVELKSKTSQTGLFKKFLKIAANDETEESTNILKIRVQDLSTTGMAIHAGELEVSYFSKDTIFQNVSIKIVDETILVPQAKIMYVVDYISNDKNIKKYKIGINFPDLPANLDAQLGKKINILLRQNDHNKDFENFLK